MHQKCAVFNFRTLYIILGVVAIVTAILFAQNMEIQRTIRVRTKKYFAAPVNKNVGFLDGTVVMSETEEKDNNDLLNILEETQFRCKHWTVNEYSWNIIQDNRLSHFLKTNDAK